MFKLVTITSIINWPSLKRKKKRFWGRNPYGWKTINNGKLLKNFCLQSEKKPSQTCEKSENSRMKDIWYTKKEQITCISPLTKSKKNRLINFYDKCTKNYNSQLINSNKIGKQPPVLRVSNFLRGQTTIWHPSSMKKAGTCHLR